MKRVLSIIAGYLVAGAVLGAAALAACFPNFTETVLVGGVFRLLSAVFGTLTQYIPFSLAEMLVVLAVPVAVVLTVILVRRRVKWRSLVRGIGWTLSAVLLWYMLSYGVLYGRQTLAQKMELSDEPVSVEELTELCTRLADEASAARARCAEDENGYMRCSQTLSEVLADGGRGYAVLEQTYPFVHGTVNRVKPVQLSHWWSYTGITGVYFPLLAEANVNIDIPDSERLMTVCHELAHTRGFAHEDECNLLGILSCISHPHADWQYSGWLAAYIYVSNSLYTASPSAWQAVRDNHLSDGVRRDLYQRAVYWQSFQGTVMEVSDRANNAFIQLNGDTDGVRRYDMVTDLLAAYFREK